MGADDAPADDPDQAIDSLIAEIGGEVSQHQVVVFRRTADGNKIARCKRFPLEGFDVDALPALFGAGDYTLNVIDAHGAKVRVLRVTFDPASVPATPAAVTPGSQTGAPVPPAAVAPDAAREVHALMLESEREHRRSLESLLTAVIGRNASPGPTLADQVGAMKMILEMTRPASREATPAKDVTEALKLGLELARDTGGEGPARGGGWFDRILEQLGPILAGVISASGARGAAPPVVAGAPAAPAPRPALPGPAPAARVDMFGQVERAAPPPAPPEIATVTLPPEWAPYAFLSQYVQRIRQVAGMPPDVIAQFIYHAIPEEHMPALASFVGLDDDARSKILLALDSTLAPYMFALHQVARSIRDEIAADGDGDGAEAGES